MTQLRVIHGGGDAPAVQSDDLPVPASLLNPAVPPPKQSRWSKASPSQQGRGAPGLNDSLDSEGARDFFARSSSRESSAPGDRGAAHHVSARSASSSSYEYGRYGMKNADNSNDIKENLVQPLPANTVAIVSQINGVGTSTITAYLAAYFATYRPGAVTAVDGDTDSTPLNRLLTGQSAPEFQVSPEALKTRDAMTTQTVVSPSGVRAIVAPQSSHTNAQGIAAFARALRRHFDSVFLDIHPQVEDPAKRSMLSFAQLVVIVTGPNREGGRAAEQMLDWLEENGHDRLNTIVVINGSPKFRGKKIVEFMRAHFAQRAGAVVVLPLAKELSAPGRPAVSLATMPSDFRDGISVLAEKVMDRLRAYEILDLEVSPGGGSSGAELRVVPTMGDHDAGDLRQSGGYVSQTGGVIRSQQPTPAAFARPTNEGE